MRRVSLLLSVLTITVASAAPQLQAAPCDGYKEAYELARDGIEVVAVGADFCIVRYDSSKTAPIITTGAVELGSANRDIYIVESYLGQEWRDNDGTETLARFGDSYIIAVEPHLLATNWAGQFEIRKVFDRPIQPPDITQEYPPIEENALVREMVNRLNASDYGDFLEGLVDETPSRYTYSPLITQATDYTYNHFRASGLITGIHEYPGEPIPTTHFGGIHWLDDRYGSFNVDEGYGFRTVNSGGDWFQINTGSNLYFTSAEHGYSSTAEILYETTDGGRSWHKVAIPDIVDYVYEIEFLNDNFGVICCLLSTGYPENWGGCLITKDGGSSWHLSDIPETDYIWNVSILSPDRFWVCGFSSDIFVTDDGGDSFVKLPAYGLPNGTKVLGINFFNENEGVIAGDGLLAYTEDGGQNWTTIPIYEYLTDMHFGNDSRGWVCGSNGTLKYTEDRGHNWVDVDTGSDSFFFGVSTREPSEIWVVGLGKTMLRSTDGGMNWEEIYIETGELKVWENVIGELPGKTRPDEIYIICSHYDAISYICPWSRSIGAEDNASGSAGVLHLAKIMSQYDFASTIRFCCWSGEEQGLKGSYAYASEAFDRGDDIHAVYNMDMISFMDDDSYDSTVGYIQEFENLLTSCIEARDIYVPVLELFPDENRYGSDQASFWEFGYPAIYTIEHDGTEYYPWYHTTGDTYDHLRYDYGVLNAKLGAALIGFLAEPLSGPNFTTADVYAYPNPARPDTDFVTFANVPADSSIAIYTISGDKVATVYERNLEARWYLRGDSGEEVASGVYLYYLDTGIDTKIGKIAVLH